MKQNKNFWTNDEQAYFTQKEIAEMAKLNFKTFQRWSIITGLHYEKGLIHKDRIPEILETLKNYGLRKAQKASSDPTDLSQ